MRSSYGSGSFGKRKRYDENRAPSIRDDGKKPPSESAGRHHKMNARPKSTDADIHDDNQLSWIPPQQQVSPTDTASLHQLQQSSPTEVLLSSSNIPPTANQDQRIQLNARHHSHTPGSWQEGKQTDSGSASLAADINHSLSTALHGNAGFATSLEPTPLRYPAPQTLATHLNHHVSQHASDSAFPLDQPAMEFLLNQFNNQESNPNTQQTTVDSNSGLLLESQYRRALSRHQSYLQQHQQQQFPFPISQMFSPPQNINPPQHNNQIHQQQNQLFARIPGIPFPMDTQLSSSWQQQIPLPYPQQQEAPFLADPARDFDSLLQTLSNAATVNTAAFGSHPALSSTIVASGVAMERPPHLHLAGRSSGILYLPSDDATVSDYQCLARKQMEFFEANEVDVEAGAQGRNKRIILGQVGIRCRHCAHLYPSRRTKSSTYYPRTLKSIYQTAQNMANTHLTKTCHDIPAFIRQELIRLSQDRKTSAGGGKEYWADRARSLGVFETGTHLIIRRTVALGDGEAEDRHREDGAGGQRS